LSMVENIRARIEELRTTLQTRLGKIRGGGGQLFEGNLLSGQLVKAPIISEVREKGAMAVIEERFPRVKEVREKGIIAQLRGTAGGVSLRTGAPAAEKKAEVVAPAPAGFKLRK